MGILTTILLDSIGETVKESSIIQGQIYTYHGLPSKCQGHSYQVEDFIEDVPSYQQKVLVRCLSGPHRGKRFCCSLDNFNTRYKLKEEKEVESNPEIPKGKVAGQYTKGEIVT